MKADPRRRLVFRSVQRRGLYGPQGYGGWRAAVSDVHEGEIKADYMMAPFRRAIGADPEPPFLSPRDPRPYAIEDISRLPTPALVVYPSLIRRNIAELIRIAGSPARLWPHVKTHKTREAVRLLLDAGVTKHKCATPTEAEMLARCGASEVLLAYPLVGPNPGRLRDLAVAYPATRFSALIDHPAHAVTLSAAFAACGITAGFFVDLNVGMNRTGIAPEPAAAELYRRAAGLPGLRPEGPHVYDGHHQQESPS